MNPETNFSLVERARGNGPAIGTDELLELLTELDDWRTSGDIAGVDSPEQLVSLVTEMDKMSKQQEHAQEMVASCIRLARQCSRYGWDKSIHLFERRKYRQIKWEAMQDAREWQQCM